MKKITLIFTVFVLILSTQSYAQIANSESQPVDRIEYDDQTRDAQKAKKLRRKKAHKHAKQRKRTQKRQIKAMRRVARADGNVSPREKAVIKEERRKMKRKNKHRAIQRKRNMHKSSEFVPDKN